MNKDRLSSLPPEILKQLQEMSEGKPEVKQEPKFKTGRPTNIVSDGEGNPVSTCSCCNKNVIRRYTHTLPSGVKWYVDTENRRWRGKNCPDCAYKKHLTYLRKIRGTKRPRV